MAIERKLPTPHTVIVVGAGASWPYNFPIGTELPEVIKDQMRRPMAEALLPTAHSQAEYDHISRALKRAPDALQARRFETIDQYLERCGDSPAAYAMKLAMSYVFLRAEHEYAISYARARGPDWYHELFNHITEADDDDIAGTKLLTFNYERSLEFDIRRAIRHEADMRGQRWRTLPIVPWHLHGAVGPSSDWRVLDEMGQAPITVRQIMDGAERIRSYSENQTDWDEPRKWIQSARRLVFLGFGFHPTNIRNLGITSDGPRPPWRLRPQVWANAYSAADHQPTRQEQVQEALGCAVHWVTGDCLALIRKLGNPFKPPLGFQDADYTPPEPELAESEFE